jgi:hypothetical protein
MGFFNLKFRSDIPSTNPAIAASSVVNELDSLVSEVSAWAAIQHNQDGTHAFSGSGFDLIPVGGIIQWHAGITTPARWLLTDGSAVRRSTFPLLFKAIGITYGPGDGISTFTLPSLNGGTPKYIILAGQ